jgi:UDP-glucose-4-epimerase GalE
MRNVLVTGGAGYIGSHACKALSNAGYLPVALDNLCLGHRDFVRWGPLVVGDVRDRDTVLRVLGDYDIDAVMHFAAFACVGESISDPAKYYDNNVIGILSLLHAMRGAGLARLVFSSTCAVYGEPKAIPIDEGAPTQPINPYGRSKLMCETVLHDFASAYGIQTVALRYFNAAGADPDGQLGEKRPVETHLIPRALMHLQGHLDDFAVFGSNYPTPDGTAIRDYVHVNDLADGHVLALQYLSNTKRGGTFNLGTGQGYSVQEVLAAISRTTGRDVASISGGRRHGDPAVLVADCQRAEETLGFRPRRSDLETIITTAWRWHQRAHPRRADTLALG